MAEELEEMMQNFAVKLEKVKSLEISMNNMKKMIVNYITILGSKISAFEAHP